MRKALLWCGFAPVVFVIVLLVEGWLRPGYDPVHQFGSELSLGPRGWIQVTNFVVTGVLVLAFATRLRGALAVLIAIFGATLVVAGLFTTDPNHQSVAGMIHDLNSLPNFAALAAATFVASAKRIYRWYSAGTGVVVVAGFVAAIATPEHGLWQRICIVAGFCWVGALAVRTARPSP
ncbi:hypothetical protein Lesp02_25760 [Lentzea sp. NBRC 105346]|uniref:DUF998 domain-containing protein n=1 Tax=Lentzea sp. NBRC 105346 TaxID=3032205 RepID=UPI002552A3D6|nr:DUF998 domain-containing protein [Lentzea sp. NBRC 105346]GLZ30387.1 hypothetical protein Lesp02_25760 [Lentzea sp. NBRC 105346]